LRSLLEICNEDTVKDPITPQTCRYNTWIDTNLYSVHETVAKETKRE